MMEVGVDPPGPRSLAMPTAPDLRIHATVRRLVRSKTDTATRTTQHDGGCDARDADATCRNDGARDRALGLQRL